MSRFATRTELIEDAQSAWERLDALLDTIPEERMLDEVTEDMSVRDFMAHRAHWSRMTATWYRTARAGGEPEVPAPGYSWRQLPELNVEIHAAHATDTPANARSDLIDAHNDMMQLIAGCTDEELFVKGTYAFTGSTDLAAYFTSATGGHYRSATKHIRKWWRSQS